jgi:hypothetical protein
LRVSQRGRTHRRLGQPASDSSSARTNPSGLGGSVTVVLLVLSAFVPSGASAAPHASASNPSPQPAPQVSGGSVAAPDPAPQATIRSAPSHVTTPSRPSHRVPAVVRPVSTGSEAVQAQRARVLTTPRVAPSHVVGATTPAINSPRRSVRLAHGRPVRVHYAPVVRGEPSHVVNFSIPFSFLTKDLLRLPRAAFHAGEQVHRDGVLLLFSSIAMATLAVASFTLFRRLRRLVAR